MQVIGQKYKGVNLERMRCADFNNGFMQRSTNDIRAQPFSTPICNQSKAR